MEYIRITIFMDQHSRSVNKRDQQPRANNAVDILTNMTTNTVSQVNKHSHAYIQTAKIMDQSLLGTKSSNLATNLLTNIK